MSATPEGVVLADDVLNALRLYSEAVYEVGFYSGAADPSARESSASMATEYEKELAAAIAAHVAARVGEEVPNEVRVLVETGMALVPNDSTIYKAGRAWLNALPPLTTPEARDAAAEVR
jgi:hypothetical protein